MIRTGILLCTLLVFGSVTAQQNNGFLGKKMFLDLSFRAARPIKDYNKYLSYFVRKNDQLEKGKDIFNYGMSCEIGIAPQRNLGFSINTSLLYGSIPGPIDINLTNANNQSIGNALVDHENLHLRSLIITPTIIFNTNNGLLPVGFCHEIGIGYRMTNIVERDYLVRATTFYYSYTDQNNQYQNVYYNDVDAATAALDSTIQSNGPYIDFKKKYKGASFTYALKVRKPLGENFGVNFGLRYTYNWTTIEDGYGSQEASYNINERTKSFIKDYNQFSVITFDVGLTLFF